MRAIDVLTSPWAIQREKLQEIREIYTRHLRGDKIDIAGLEAKAGVPFDNAPSGYEVIDGVAVVGLQGVIAKKMNLFTKISGGVSTELFARDVKEAREDPNVRAIIILGDTPGGTVDGTSDAAAEVFKTRGVKPIVTLADGLLASAGVWIGTAADKVYITNETVNVGSIGVLVEHVDYSEQQARDGAKVTEVYAGKYKRITSQNSPLSKDGKQYLQDRVDYLYSIFVDTVAKHRGASYEQVLDNMADGRIFIGEQAIEAGLVDGVSTLDALIAELAVKQPIAGAVINVTHKPDEEKGKMDITKEQILEEHPEIAAEFRAEGAQTGAEAERNRIQSVFGQSMAGHEDLIQELAFDGKTTGPEAAVKVLQAEKAKKSTELDKIKTDAADVSGVIPSATEGSSNVRLTDNEKAQAEWDKDEKLRAEFGGSFDTFAAYRKNSGNFKVLGGAK